MPSLVEIRPVVLENKIHEDHQSVFHVFPNSQ